MLQQSVLLYIRLLRNGPRVSEEQARFLEDTLT
jgi:hypothetical protein